MKRPSIYLSTLTESEDEIEGLDTPGDAWGEYPLDSVFVRSDIRTVGEVVSRINRERYILDPDFQRDFVWDDEKQSKLIESCVMRIPLPVFYVAEAKDGRVIVVDGLQRLTTFTRFKNGQLKLLKLGSQEKPHPLDGKKYNELPLTLQERIDDTQLTMYILDAKAPERARLDIFERVNSGAPLTRQQMRNALYNGPATEWLRLAASSENFKEATGNALRPKTMRDREAINRFCAFRVLGWDTYIGSDMDSFLGKALDKMNQQSWEELEALRRSFDQAITLNRLLFGRHAFRKSLAEADPDARLSVINIALFDVMSVVLSRIDQNTITANSLLDDIRLASIGLFENQNFMHDIAYSTNSRAQVRGRFQATEAAFANFIK